MNKINQDRNKISLENLRNGFIDFCEFYFKDDLLIQDYISDIRYFEDKVDSKKSLDDIKKFIKEFNEGK